MITQTRRRNYAKPPDDRPRNLAQMSRKAKFEKNGYCCHLTATPLSKELAIARLYSLCSPRRVSSSCIPRSCPVNREERPV